MLHPQTLFDVGDRVPDAYLPTMGDEGTRAVRGRPRESIVLVLLHGPDCAECRAYVEKLARAPEVFRRWDARLMVVLPRDVGDLERQPWNAQAEVTVLRDDSDRLAPSLGAGCVTVVVADRWGEIYEVVRDPEDHALPGLADLEEWLKFIATQCPECGVPDTPVRDAGH